MEYIDLKKDEMFLVSLKAFIVKNNRFLILRVPNINDPEWNNKWTLPGGILEMRDQLEEGLLREFKEELGDVKIKIKQPFAISDYTHQSFELRDGRKMRTRFIEIGYLCEYISGKIKLSEEHDKYRWVSKKELTEITVSKDAKGLVEQYLQHQL